MRRLIGLITIFLLLSGTAVSGAQDGDNACLSLVDEAFRVAGSACLDMGVNEACYGHDQVVATLRQGREAVFSVSGDIVPLLELETLVTKPANPKTGTWGVAVMTLQAGLPADGGDTMLFVLVGDTEVENEGTTERSDTPTCAVHNETAQNLNVRRGPGTGYAIVDVFATGDETLAIGRNDAGDWVRVEGAAATGWVYAPLVMLACDAAETLPVLSANDPEATTGPTPHFVLRTGEPGECEQAPDGLLIMSPGGHHARVSVNGVELEFSSAGFLTAHSDANLVVRGLEGETAITAFGQTVTVVPSFQSTVPLIGVEASGPPTAPIEFEVDGSPIQDLFSTMRDDASVSDPLAGVGPDDVCAVTPLSNVNLRGGPGTNYPVIGQFAVGAIDHPDGQAAAADDIPWWQLGQGRWVRSDLVLSAGACGSISRVPTPPPPSDPGQGDTQGGETGVASGPWTLIYDIGEVSGPCVPGSLTRPKYRAYNLTITNGGSTVTAQLTGTDNWGATYGENIILQTVGDSTYAGVAVDQYGYIFNHTWTFTSSTTMVGNVTFTQGQCTFNTPIAGNAG